MTFLFYRKVVLKENANLILSSNDRYPDIKPEREHVHIAMMKLLIRDELNNCCCVLYGMVL